MRSAGNRSSPRVPQAPPSRDLDLRSRRAIRATFHSTRDRGVPDEAGHSLALRMYEQGLLLFAANQPPRADKASQCWIARPAAPYSIFGYAARRGVETGPTPLLTLNLGAGCDHQCV